MRKTLLIVDDLETNIENLSLLLEERYDLLAATDGYDALELLQNEAVDLVLLDIAMPGLDGYEVCRRIKSDPKIADIPVIFITAKSDEESIEKAYETGGVDYITKPFRAKEVLSRVSTHLALIEHQHKLEALVRRRTAQLQELNQELVNTQREIIMTMGVIAENRSAETGNHIRRVAAYCEILGRAAGLDEKEVRTLCEASPMHDIGKLAIPDHILNKPAPLTPEEYETMKTHTTIGYKMLQNSKRPLLQSAAVIAREHHERWDGKGYPRGLKGEAIHIFGRITALADVFDALGSDRVYKKAWPLEKVLEHFKAERGGHFDPQLCDLFFQHIDEIVKIKEKLKD